MREVMILLCFSLLSVQLNAEVGITAPVGFAKVGDANTTSGPWWNAHDAVKANTDSWISIPFLKSNDFEGIVTSVIGNTISFAAPESPPLPNLDKPHYFLLESGSKSGLFALITSTTSDEITIALQPHESTNGIQAGDRFSVRLAWTIGNVFCETLPTGTQIATWSGNHSGINQPPDLIYQFDGAHWYSMTDSSLSDDVVLYPSETFLVRTGSTPIPLLTISGEVSQVPSRSFISNNPVSGRDNYVNYFASMDESISFSGVNTVAENMDQILRFNNEQAGHNKSPVTILQFYNGAWWDQEPDFYFDESYRFKSGVGHVFRRKGTSNLAPKLWLDVPQYLVD